MPPDLSETPHIEVAHVLFTDMVGYSRLPMDEQTRLLSEFQALVRACPEFKRAEASNELLSRPSGDGIALVFFRDPVAPLRCALEIAERLQKAPQIRLRMGIHSGPIHRVQNINAAQDVSGGGINFAQRVMDCGDAGHVLLSSAMAELLSQMGGNWASSLIDLGECEVKHGVRLHLYNFVDDAIGNPELPRALTAARPVSVGLPSGVELAARKPDATTPSASPTALTSRTLSPQSPSHPQPGASKDPLRVTLLYKRNVQPDEALLELVENALKEEGYSVFIDRHMAVGLKWAEEIERQVATADAVIPLLSERSVQSEMLEWEVETARSAAQGRNGKPRILPVRVNYTGSLYRLSFLDSLQYVLWESDSDNERLVREVIQALKTPQSSLTGVEKLEPVGGAMPLESQFYIERRTDLEFLSAMERQDSIVLVKGARQMGKTSLLARGLQKARERGAKVVLTDFQKLDSTHMATSETFYKTVGEWIADQLDLDVFPEDVWKDSKGPNDNFETYLRRTVLRQVEGPLLWAMDEVDRLFHYPYCSEVFGLFRSWYNARALQPDGPWRKLTLAIVYATESHLFITDINQSPFNVGTRLALEDFTLEQVAELNRRYGSPMKTPAEVERFYGLVHGYPFLVRRGLHEMVARGLDLEKLVSQADRDEGIYGDHLRRLLVLLTNNAPLKAAVEAALRGEGAKDSESFYHLRSAGVLIGETYQEAQMRCGLYRAYLQRHMLP